MQVSRGMLLLFKCRGPLLALALFAATVSAQSTNTFVVGAFNVQNWNSIERHGQTNQPKPPAEKTAVINVIATVRPDVLGIEEMGQPADFAELQAGLKASGIEYPYSEYVQAHDVDRHVCLLSRFPIVQRQSRTDDTYRLNGRATPIGRGLLDVLIQVNDGYSFRALVVHLKSKRQVEPADQAQMRLEEARLLRTHIDKILKKSPQVNLVAMGDFNDTPDSESMRTVIGSPPFVLFPLPCKTESGYDGTHFWAFRREWSRIDYLLTSPGLSNEFVQGSAKIYTGKEASAASDHHLISASFLSHDVGAPPAPEPIALRQAAPVVLYSIVIGVFLIVVVLGVLLMYTRRQRTQPKP